MIIKQLSVFLENKPGRLSEVLDIIENADINISAISMADTSDFGILRMICSDYQKATEELNKNNLRVSISEVISFFMPNTPGGLNKAINYLSDEDVSIEYIYAFAKGEKAMVVLRTDNPHRAIEILKKHEMELIRANELYNF